MEVYDSGSRGERVDSTDDEVKLFSIRGLAKAFREYRRDRKDGWRHNIIEPFRPPLEHYPPVVGSYQGRSGPIATLARIELNHRTGRPMGEGLPPNTLNDPNAP